MRRAFLLTCSLLLALFAACGPPDKVLSRNVPPGGNDLCPPDDAGVADAASVDAPVDPPDADLGDGDVEGSVPVEAAAPPPDDNQPKVPCAGSTTKKDAATDAAPDAVVACSGNRSCNDNVVCVEFDDNTGPATRDNVCDAPVNTQSCVTTGAIARCVVVEGNSCHTFYYFPPLYTEANAQQQCDFEGGSFALLD